MVFLAAFLLSAAVTFFLTQPVEKPKKIVTPMSASAFSIEDAPSDSLRGKITSFSGDVFWQSRIATQPAQLTFERDILQGENLLTKETGNAGVAFKNTAGITILPDTEIAFIQTLPANVVIKQLSGSAEYTKLGNTPVSVQISDLLIDQKEGILQVSVNQDISEITVAVQDGNANVAYVDAEENSSVVSVTAGNAFVYNSFRKWFNSACYSVTVLFTYPGKGSSSVSPS